MNSLLRLCREVLEDPSSTGAMRNVAGSALTTALAEDIAVPVEYVRAAWRWLRTADSYYASCDEIAEVSDEVVRVEALGVLKDPNAGRDERRIATWVLGGRGHAQHLDDHTLLNLAERTRTGQQAVDLEGLISRVHTARGIPHEVLRCIRDRWTSSTSVGVREAAVKVGTQLMDPDLSWIGRVLEDPDADVRASVAHGFSEPVEGLLELLQERLRVEACPDVRSALFQALSTQEVVEHAGDRRRRRRDRLREEASQEGGGQSSTPTR